jgi:hypothetical protein
MVALEAYETGNFHRRGAETQRKAKADHIGAFLRASAPPR